MWQVESDMSTYRHIPVANRDGFSLIELIIVIGLIGILSGAATFAFKQWQYKGMVENQIRQMATDISEVRVRALTRKQRHSITLNEYSYVFKSYSSESYSTAAELAAKGTVITGGTHTVRYALAKAVGSNQRYGGEVCEVDERGALVVSADCTIFPVVGGNVVPVTAIFLKDGGGNYGSVNCLTITPVRVNAGLQSASGTCDDQ